MNSVNPKLVSIVTIFLNEESFLADAIESILDQSYPHWELLLVDDGSTDTSSSIAQRYARQHPDKIRYLDHPRHENRGMSASRNLGIHHADGSYLGFLDADDIWLPQKLEEQVAILDSHPEAALVCGRTKWWYSWTGNTEDLDKDFLQKYSVELNALVPPPEVLLMFLKDEWASLCDILTRTELVKKIGGYENKFKGMYEDQVFHTKLCMYHPVYVSSKCWYLYRQHPQACTAVSHSQGRYHKIRFQFLNWLESYLNEQDNQHPEIRKIIKDGQFPYRYPLLFQASQFVKNSLSKFF